MATTISLDGGVLTVEVRGLDKLRSLASRLDSPLEHDSFARLVVEVDDPLATVQLIQCSIADRAGSADS